MRNRRTSILSMLAALVLASTIGCPPEGSGVEVLVVNEHSTAEIVFVGYLDEQDFLPASDNYLGSRPLLPQRARWVRIPLDDPPTSFVGFEYTIQSGLGETGRAWSPVAGLSSSHIMTMTVTPEKQMQVRRAVLEGR